jgi:hypothetical protein
VWEIIRPRGLKWFKVVRDFLSTSACQLEPENAAPFVAVVNTNPAAMRLDGKFAKRETQPNGMVLSVGAGFDDAKFFKYLFSRFQRNTRAAVDHG